MYVHVGGRGGQDRINHMTSLLQQEGEDSHGLMYVTQQDMSTLPCYEVSRPGWTYVGDRPLLPVLT